ncbi:hypothetical protein [Kibdelosporangium philippinense]
MSGYPETNIVAKHSPGGEQVPRRGWAGLRWPLVDQLAMRVAP